MDASLYAFVDDLDADGGPGRVLDLGVSGITIAAAYHRARDVTPHGRARVTLRHDGVHFPPGEPFDGLRLAPPVQRDAARDPLRALRGRLAGAALHGWGVFLHNTTLGLAHPDLTQENCFGDRAAPADLCPSRPDVRAYAVALGRAIARRGVDSVVAESLHFGAFGHGYHHERCFVDLGAAAELALSLCFCPACLARVDARTTSAVDARTTSAAAARATSAEAARTAAVRLAGAVLDGGPPAEEVPEPLMAYARARTDVVTSLAAEVAQAVADEGSRLVFMDLTGAAKGYADGLPSGAAAPDDAWRLGIDPAALGAVVPGYAALGYARDAGRIARDVAGYRAALGDGVHLRVVLRPGPPDAASAEDLAGKVAAARAAGADAVDFYHYGLVTRAVLDRVPAAL